MIHSSPRENQTHYAAALRRESRDERQSVLALWLAFYNFARKHMSLGKETPAMASGLENHVWTIRELIDESAKY